MAGFIAEVTYEHGSTWQVSRSELSLPPQMTGPFGYLKVQILSAQDTMDNMCYLIESLRNCSWDHQLVSVYSDIVR